MDEKSVKKNFWLVDVNKRFSKLYNFYFLKQKHRTNMGVIEAIYGCLNFNKSRKEHLYMYTRYMYYEKPKFVFIAKIIKLLSILQVTNRFETHQILLFPI